VTDFIHEEYLDDITVCDALIEYFHTKPPLRGEYGLGNETIIDLDVKDSYDVRLEVGTLALNYFNNLQMVIDSYIEKYEESQKGPRWGIAESANIQHYLPGGGFKSWHFERSGNNIRELSRHLVFMTYLNDVTDSGGTEFKYQNKIVTPKKGLTLIWPADWTHTHRGIVSPTQDKYIITGWLSYL
jgi:hypothetical protein